MRERFRRRSRGDAAETPLPAAAPSPDAEVTGPGMIDAEAIDAQAPGGTHAAAAAETATGTPAEVSAPGPKVRKSWSGTRLVALLAGVAVVSLLLGILAMQFIVSPADIASRTAPPEAGPVTASVEERIIENTIVTRGEITYADAVDVTIDASGSGERPVITGQVPAVGAVFNSASIALEIAGRPVVVLPGELPAYRSLSIGMRGPDVVQLKAALSSLGYASGDPSTDTFDWDTAAGIGALYEQLGYPAAAGGEDAADALRSAERAVRDADVSLAQARATLAEASTGEAPNTLAEQAAVNAASDQLSDAQVGLEEAQQRTLPTLPSSEVLYLSDLPRRVDDIKVARGDVLSGSPMSVSGATLTIVGTLSQQDAELLTEGAGAVFPAPGGGELTATVASITAPRSGGDDQGSGTGEEGGANPSGQSGSTGNSRYTVSFQPQDLTPEQIDQLRGTNVRVTVPIAATDGAVLAVPIAALSAGSGGEDRVELLTKAGAGADAETEQIEVVAGLAADGYVEITSDDPRITLGARVVVGR